MTKDQIFEFFRRLAEDNPEPETELEYGYAYQLTVAVALSAQATDVGVNKATRARDCDAEGDGSECVVVDNSANANDQCEFSARQRSSSDVTEFSGNRKINNFFIGCGS